MRILIKLRKAIRSHLQKFRFRRNGNLPKLGLTLFVLSCLFAFNFSESAMGTKFKEWRWNSIKIGSTIYHKPVMVFVYGGFCIHSQNTMNEFNNSKVGSFYNHHFICFRMNADKLKDFLKANTMGVHSVPTLLYFNSKNKLCMMSEGEHNRSRLLEVGQTAFDKIQKEDQAEKQKEIDKANAKRYGNSKPNSG